MTLPRGPAELPPALNALTDLRADLTGGCGSGAGGSGLVVIKLLTSDYSSTTTGSPTVTTSGSYTILTYTGSGTYTV